MAERLLGFLAVNLLSRTKICLCALGIATHLNLLTLQAEEFEAISGRTSPDYVRIRQADGSFKPESYAFGRGGYWSGPLDDKTIEKMSFLDIAHIMAVPLAAEGYVTARDPKTTNLLIMVYWGTTFAPEHASDTPVYNHLADAEAAFTAAHGSMTQTNGRSKFMPGDPLFEEVTTAIAAVQAENRMRDNQDRRNAMMLGYDSLWDATFDAQNGTPLEVQKRDMLSELEEYRYFVVLMAYDFQLLSKQKKHKLLWETRFSIREHVNAFDLQLPAMALGASKYFGSDSKGLVHDTLPEGRVELGEVKNLGVVPNK
jgi:hypothetical protein